MSRMPQLHAKPAGAKPRKLVPHDTAEQRSAVAMQHALGLPIHIGEPPFPVQSIKGVTDGFHRLAQTLGELPLFGFGPLPPGNILAGSGCTQRAPVGSVQYMPALLHVLDCAVRQQQAVLDHTGIRMRKGFGKCSLHLNAISRMHQFQKRLVAGHKKSLVRLKYPMGFLGPYDRATRQIRFPTPDLRHRLGRIQTLGTEP